MKNKPGFKEFIRQTTDDHTSSHSFYYDRAINRGYAVNKITFVQRWLEGDFSQTVNLFSWRATPPEVRCLWCYIQDGGPIEAKDSKLARQYVIWYKKFLEEHL